MIAPIPLLRALRSSAILVFGLVGIFLIPSARTQHVHQTKGIDQEKAAQPESTLRMIERLAELDRNVDPSATIFFPDKAVSMFEKLIREAPSPEMKLRLQLPYANALLNNGQTEAAIEQMTSFRDTMTSRGFQMPPKEGAEFLQTLAIAHIRLGEQENCLHNHNADSCLFPIQGGGVHLSPRGSRGAIEVLDELLVKSPTPFAAWLLNIAYMTLGEYPDQVPERWRLPPELIASDYEMNRFADVAGPLGLDVDDVSGSVVMEDFDGDGFLDLMVSAWGFNGQLRYFRNQGDGSFDELTVEAGLHGLKGGLNLVHGDYNNDGYPDVLVLREGWLGKDGRFPNSLLRNDGDNTFTDVTEESGMLTLHSTQTATWFDYDNDGWLDVFVGNENDPCELFRNNGDGTFTECAAENGVAIVDWVKAVVSGDFNNDGLADLYISSLSGPNRLLRNDGAAGGESGDGPPKWVFTNVAKEAGVAEPLRSFPCWFWDYDNDGWQDLFVTGYSIQNAGDILIDYFGFGNNAEKARLYRNKGDGTFEDVTESQGLMQILHAMGCNFGDLDSDGWLDFYVGTGDPSLGTIIPSLMFRNNAGRGFQDVTVSGGFGQLQKGHGVAFGDINHDGAQDVYSVVGGAFSGDHYHNQLFANPGHDNRWISLRLEGVESNRFAVGARIKVVAKMAGREREIHRVVTSGGSFGASSFRQDIGLGKAVGIARVEVFWPVTGKIQVLENLDTNRFYHVREGEQSANEIDLATFDWPSGADATHHHAH